MRFRVFLSNFLLFIALAAFAQPSFIEDSLDAYIQKGMEAWQVPGLSIVIVKDGKVVKRQGYGVKDVNHKTPVNEETLFFIASNTKLFTATALSMLAVDNKLSLNDKITKYFPKYKLFDEKSTEMVTIKDMLTHRIGTKTFQGDFTFWDTNLSRAEIMTRMRLLKPVYEFREAYGYCNSCYLTAGEVIPKVTIESWEQYIEDKILKPLEMKNSTATSNGIEFKSKNIAVPYTTSYTNTLKKVPYDRWDNMGPAASIVSNVKDLTNWLFCQLDSGKYNGLQIIPWKAIQGTRDMQIFTGSRKSMLYPMHFRGYGLGVFAADYNGKQIYWHTGGAAGMLSNVCMVPEERLGIAILSTNDNQNFFEALRFQILDAYLGVPYQNRSNTLLKNHNDQMMATVEKIKKWKQKASETAITERELEKYAGIYDHELYGKISVENNVDHLSVIFHTHPNLTATLKHMGEGDWLIEYNNVEFGIFSTKFVMKKNRVKALMVKMNEFVEMDEYEFKKE